MRICIVSLGKNLDSEVSPRFGRAPFFLFLDEQGNLKEVVSNSGTRAMRGAGIAAAQEISSRGTKVLISGNIGPNALEVLLSAGIKIFSSPFNLKVKEVFKKWKKGELSIVETPMPPGGFRRGGGFQGKGRRRWGR